MTTQSEALRLADELDAYHTRSCHKEASAELRRLHAENEELRKALDLLTAFVPDGACPTCGSDCNERDELIKAEREIERLNEALRAALEQPGVEPEVHDAKCPALTGDDCKCSERPTFTDKPWARFCGAIGRGPNAPYPGMIEAFESHYSQSFTDRDWRDEAGVWVAAWKVAKAQPAPQPAQQAQLLTSEEKDYITDSSWSYIDAVNRTQNAVLKKNGMLP